MAVAALAGAALIAGCGSGNQSSSAASTPRATTTAPPSTTAATGSYNPKIEPAKFTSHITNHWFPLKPGTTMILKGSKDGTPQTHNTRITRRTRTIMGVPCAVVKDVVTDPNGVAEIAYDWYAQDDKGNVWYFGESTADYAKGVVTTTKGSWEAGVDNAKPGIVMPAHPKPGPAFYQEYRPGIAEDQGKVLAINRTVRVKSGTYRTVVVIRDTNPLDPTLVQHKWYAPGVGVVKSIRTGSSHTETSQLVAVR
jgi:hypothetical protein